MNVDTGQFQALTERLERVERALEAMDVAAEILSRAGMDNRMREVARRQAARQAAREARHLRPVE